MPCPSIDPKLFWTHPNCFGLDQHVLNMVKSWFLSDSKCFESIKKIGTGLNNFGPVQNVLDIWLCRTFFFVFWPILINNLYLYKTISSHCKSYYLLQILVLSRQGVHLRCEGGRGACHTGRAERKVCWRQSCFYQVKIGATIVVTEKVLLATSTAGALGIVGDYFSDYLLTTCWSLGDQLVATLWLLGD